MSDELREEIARALAKNDDKCRNLPWPALRRGIQDAFISDADAILPIIARVRDEAREAGYYQGVDEGYKRACLNRQSPF